MKNVALIVYVDPRVKADLERLARRSQRSTAAMCRVVIDEGLRSLRGSG